MRAHRIMTIAVIVGLAASCSPDPSADVAADGAELERQLALPESGSPGAAVVSELESGQQVESAPVKRAAVRPQAPQQAVTEPSARAGTEPAIPDINIFVVAAPTRMHAPAVSVTSPRSTDAEEAGNEPAPVEGDDGVRAPRRGVIIRGGVMEDDDCKIHMPRGMTPPRPGALVNQRGPRLGLPAMRGGGIR